MGFVLLFISHFNFLLFIALTLSSFGFSVPLAPSPSSLIPPFEARGPSSVNVPGLLPDGSTLHLPTASPPTKPPLQLPPSLSPIDLTSPPKHALAASTPAQPPLGLAPPQYAQPPHGSSGMVAETPSEKPYGLTPPPVTDPLHDSAPPPSTEPPLVSSHSPVAEPPFARPHKSSAPLHESPSPRQLVTPDASPPLSIDPSHSFFSPPPMSPHAVGPPPFLASSPHVTNGPKSSAPLTPKPPETLSPPPFAEAPQSLNAPPPLKPRPFLSSQPPTLPPGPPLASDIHSPPIPPESSPPSTLPLPVGPPPFLASTPHVPKVPHSSALPLAAKPPKTSSKPPFAEPPQSLNAPPPLKPRPFLPSEPSALPPGPPFLASTPHVPKVPHSSVLPLAAKPPETLSKPPFAEPLQSLNTPPPLKPRPFLPSEPPALPPGPPLATDIHFPLIPPESSPPSVLPLSVGPPPFFPSLPRGPKGPHSPALPMAVMPPESLSPPPHVELPERLNAPPPSVPTPFLPSQPPIVPPGPPHALDNRSSPIPPKASSSPPEEVPSSHVFVPPPLTVPPPQNPPPTFVASPPPVVQPPHASVMQSPPMPPLESSPPPQIFPPQMSPDITYIPPQRPSPLFAPPSIESPSHPLPPPSSTMPGSVPPQSSSPPPFLTPPIASPPLVMPSPASMVPPAMVPVHAFSVPPPTSQTKETQTGSPPLPASPEPSPYSRTSGNVPPIHHVIPKSYPPVSQQVEAPRHSAPYIISNVSGLHTPPLATPTPNRSHIVNGFPPVAPSSPAHLSPHHGFSPIKSPSKPNPKIQNGTSPAPFSSLVPPPQSIGFHYSPRYSPAKGTDPFIAPASHKPTLPPLLPPSSSASEGSYSYTPSPSASNHGHLHPRDEVQSPAPASDLVPPPVPTQQAVSPNAANAPNPSLRRRHKYRPSPPPSQGSPVIVAPSQSPSESSEISPAPSPVFRGSGGHSEIPLPSPKISPSGSSTRNSKRPLAPPIQTLPPPPPNEDCASFTCPEPFTNTPPGAPCGCVWPMQVALRLSVALYTFFPLVSELAREIASGVFVKQSQVRIMGASAATESPEKTIVIVDLVPLAAGGKFENSTVFNIAERFWHKQVAIDNVMFGDYDVLYVRYPGLPPSPPLAPGDNDVINGMPYSVGDANGRKVHPLGVDVPKQNHKPRLNGSLIAVIVFSATLGVLICCAAAWIFIFRHKNHNPQRAQTPRALGSIGRSSGPTGNSTGSGPGSTLSYESSLAPYTGSAKTFSANEIERATDNFNPSRIIGEGGFGRVYSGVLEDETSVAVKVLKRDDHHGAREFLAEVEMLSRLHHRNLVKLIGICIDERMRCLVYELIPNGSVESHLHGTDKETASLDWASRIKIALGAARGLAYLHEDSSPRVIHRDFKSSNILLENDFTPKVSDFGLARTALDEENRHISTRVMGTFGYVAPEYAMTGHLLVKSDVYSYGVVLLELLTGKKPVDMSQPPGQENLVAWTRPLLTSKEGLESIIDSSLGLDVPFESVAKVAAIASMCVQPEVSHRPFMGEVVQALKLVCNECDDSKEGDSRTPSHENLLMYLDETKVGALDGEKPDPLQTRISLNGYLPGNDIEKGLSVSEVFSLSTRLGGQDSGSFRRHSASGPIRTKRVPQFWQRIKRASQGSESEHGTMYRWAGSH